MPSTNIDMLQTVAYGLRELKDDMVFIGGAVAEYPSDQIHYLEVFSGVLL